MLIYLYGDGMIRIIDTVRDNHARKALSIVSVPQIYQPLQGAAYGTAVEVEFGIGSIVPYHIVQAVHIGLVHFLIVGPGHAFQAVVLEIVHQHLAAGNLDGEPAAPCVAVRIVEVGYLRLLYLHVHNLGELVYQEGTPVTELIRVHAFELYGVDLFVQGGDFAGDAVDFVHLHLDFFIHVLLQLLQIARHIVEILGEGSGIAHELFLEGQIVRVLHQFLQTRNHQLVEHGLESGVLAVVMEVGLYLLHVVYLLLVLAYLLIVVPESEIVEFIAHALDGQGLHAGTGAAVGLEHPQGVCGLCGHLLAAVAFGLYVGDVVGRGVQRSVAGQQSGICYIQSEKL